MYLTSNKTNRCWLGVCLKCIFFQIYLKCRNLESNNQHCRYMDIYSFHIFRVEHMIWEEHRSCKWAGYKMANTSRLGWNRWLDWLCRSLMDWSKSRGWCRLLVGNMSPMDWSKSRGWCRPHQMCISLDWHIESYNKYLLNELENCRWLQVSHKLLGY